MGSVVLVVGGRDYLDRRRIAEALAEFDDAGAVLMSPGGSGAEAIAEGFWRHTVERPVVIASTPWARVGRPAGQMTTSTILKGNILSPHAAITPEVVIVFPGGKGSTFAVQEARRHGIEVRKVGW